MAHGITIKSLNDTAARILTLWDEASVFESAASMRELNYPPHMTLAIFSDDPGHMVEMSKDVFSSQPSLSITFDAINYFENDFLVLWARPRISEALINLHKQLHGAFDPSTCHEHYRVGRWVPHCSLATKVPQSNAVAAIQWARGKKLEFSVDFDAADCLQFPPVAVRKEYRLLR